MINRWHDWLDMYKHDEAWHTQDLADELAEYSEKQSIFKKWSELSDVVYTSTRAKWTGHNINFPFSKLHYYVGATYMFPKYTARFLFYRAAGKKAGVQKLVHEVRNPKKTHKLHHIAEKYNLDKEQFQKICEKQLKYWLLLP